MRVPGTHVPDAGVTRVHKFNLGSLGDEIAVVCVMDALTFIGIEGGRAREDWEERLGVGQGRKQSKLQEGDQEKALLWGEYEFTRQGNWGQPKPHAPSKKEQPKGGVWPELDTSQYIYSQPPGDPGR